MFITQGAWLRKHGRWILAGVLVLLIPGFVALFSTTGGTGRQQTELPTVLGKPVNAGEYQQARNNVLAQIKINSGGRMPRVPNFDEQVAQEAVTRLLLLRRAREMDITVTDDDVIKEIQNQRAFHDAKGQFDPELYRRHTVYLNNIGISEPEFEYLVREEITVNRLRALVTAAVAVTPQEVRLEYDPTHEKIAIDVAEFDAANFAPATEPTEDELKAYYEQNKERFRRPAQVKVRYALFGTDTAKQSVTVSADDITQYYERNKAQYTDADKKQKPLEAVKEEIRQELLTMRALGVAGDRATEFTVKLVAEPGAPRPDFAKLATDAGLVQQETDYFGPRDTVTNVVAGPPFNQAAFALGHDVPFSDPVGSTNGYYVLELLGRRESEIPPFDEVKPTVANRLKQQHAMEAAQKHGLDALTAVKSALATGKSFPEACEAAGVKFRSLEPFSLSEEVPALPPVVPIRQNALSMRAGTVSEFFRSSNGGLFFYLRERLPPSAAQFEKERAQFTQQILQRNREALFQDWVTALVRQQQVNLGTKRPQPPQEESQPEPEPQPSSVPAPASS